MPDEPWFEYNGVRLPLFHHLYNLTFLNERQVEVAIAKHWLDTKAPGPWWLDAGLEVGNVLSHYWRCRHQVVDLNERPAWYQADQDYHNLDLFELAGKSHLAEWVVSLSTVEHTANPGQAIDLLQTLAPVGLVTFPTGVDPALDSWLEGGAPGPYSVRTLCRVQNDHGGWEQTPLTQVRPYGPWANCVAVLEWGVQP